MSRSEGALAIREGEIPVGNGRLHYRDVGQGRPIVILHGGPDFSYAYLLPELDILSDSHRLLYYDQRGRGQSADGFQPGDVTLESEMEDLEDVRRFFRLDSFAVLGHSWGGILAMEYATRHPNRLSHLILMNSAPASHHDRVIFQKARSETAAAEIEAKRELAATLAYRSGDLATDAAYYRAHFGATVRSGADLERIVGRLRQGVTPEIVRKSRAIENRLYIQTWDRPGYDLIPRLRGLGVPTLVIHAERDFIPRSCGERIADAVPGARFVVVPECGHFAYFERPDAVCDAITDFMTAAG